MYWPVNMTNASASAVVSTSSSCATSGLVSRLEMWVGKGLVVRVDWGVVNLELRYMFKVHIARPGWLSQGGHRLKIYDMELDFFLVAHSLD